MLIDPAMNACMAASLFFSPYIQNLCRVSASFWLCINGRSFALSPLYQNMSTAC